MPNVLRFANVILYEGQPFYVISTDTFYVADSTAIEGYRETEPPAEPTGMTIIQGELND